MTDAQAVAIIAATLRAADIVACQAYYAHSPNEEWRSYTTEELVEQANNILRAAHAPRTTEEA